MKKKMKILSALSLTLLLLFSSCEKDLYDEPAYQEKYKLEKIPISKLLKNKKFNSAFYKTFKTDYQSKFSANKGIFNRETEGYIITDSVANVASFENNISYNFKIEYPSKPTSDTIFNLVVYEDELGNAENYITKNLEINQILTLVEITDSNDVSKTVLLDCISFHSSPRYFDEYTLGIDWDCVDSYNNTGGGGTGSSTGGTGFNSGGGTGSGSGTGTGSNSGGPILTSPTGGNPNGNTVNTPCNLISKLKKDVDFKAKLASFKNSAATDNFEKYSVVYNDPTPNTTAGQEDAYDYEDFQGAEDAQGGAYTGNSTMQGVIHTHYQGLTSIFSPDDLQDMYNQMIYPDITDDFFIGVVTAEGTAYILQVVDRQAFINFGNQYLSTDKKMREFTNNTYKKVYNLTSGNRANNEKNFLKMMEDLGTGLSLAGTTYMPSATTSPNLFSNLQVKTIDDLTQNVKNTNCN